MKAFRIDISNARVVKIKVGPATGYFKRIQIDSEIIAVFNSQVTVESLVLVINFSFGCSFGTYTGRVNRHNRSQLHIETGIKHSCGIGRYRTEFQIIVACDAGFQCKPFIKNDFPFLDLQGFQTQQYLIKGYTHFFIPYYEIVTAIDKQAISRKGRFFEAECQNFIFIGYIPVERPVNNKFSIFNFPLHDIDGYVSGGFNIPGKLQAHFTAKNSLLTFFFRPIQFKQRFINFSGKRAESYRAIRMYIFQHSVQSTAILQLNILIRIFAKTFKRVSRD